MSATVPSSGGTAPTRSQPEEAATHDMRSGKQGSSPSRFGERLMLTGTWLVAISVVLFAGFLAWRVRGSSAAPLEPTLAPTLLVVQPTTQLGSVGLPTLSGQSNGAQAITRLAMLHTTIPERERQKVITYTVEGGDAIFSIAKSFDLDPETVLYANYDQLNDSPDFLTLGMVLRIPPVDGIYYQWQEGDTLENIANEYLVKPEDILGFTGNKIDLTNPQIEVGQWVMIPDGYREPRQWIIPVIPRGQAGVAKSLYGSGACDGGYTGGAYGTGTFVWPTDSHTLSGNDYWSGHLAIDIAAGLGDPVYAADSGVIVFSGSSSQGYGLMIMIDHGNGYQTLYAHLSSVSAGCGRSVYQGQYIGGTGTTGNSTGTHLHFEVRYLGGFVSPWYVLPPP